MSVCVCLGCIFLFRQGMFMGKGKKKRRLFLKSSSKCDFIIQPCWSFCLEHAMCHSCQIISVRTTCFQALVDF